MTADERIEKLLNRFGQTISDLPKVSNGFPYDYAYSKESRSSAIQAALLFAYDRNGFYVLADYICHLCDVIDRLEIALETAVKCAPCHTCANIKYCDGFSCDDFRIEDEHLSDVSEEDLNEEVYGERK